MADSKLLTMDEINAMLTEIAKNEDAGADRFRALKMLASANTTVVALPEPMESGELTDRIARILLYAGDSISKIAYRRAFRYKKDSIENNPKLKYDDAPPEIIEKADKIRSVAHLYKVFPEVKRAGTPKGFPTTRSIMAQREWLKRAAIKLYMDREGLMDDTFTGINDLKPQENGPSTEQSPAPQDGDAERQA